MPAEYHLFILWEHARAKEREILEDLGKRFQLTALLEITWSPKRVAENYTRFYGTQLPPGSAKEVHCGTGPFLAAIVADESPEYAPRKTSKGTKEVNVRTFDAKMLYRSWTGGGHRIHATNSVAEAQRDLTLLLGPDWQTELGKSSERVALRRDLAGAAGWSSLEQFFSVLNKTIRYVVLRNFDILPHEHATPLHGDIDLLTDAYEDLVFLASGTKVHTEKYRVHFKVPVGSEMVPFDFRHLGDDYYDRQWEEDILRNRVYCSRGFFTPSAKDHFYSLLYHAVLHKRSIAPDYIPKLRLLASEAGAHCEPHLSYANQRLLHCVLKPFLLAQGYSCPRPVDQSVYYNEGTLDGQVELKAVEQGLPLIGPASDLVSARLLVEQDGQKYFSYVYFPPNSQSVLKQASGNLATREAAFLQKLTHPAFPRVIGSEQKERFSVARFEKINGTPLQRTVQSLQDSPQKLAAFCQGCLEILENLQAHQITHRDIHLDNILVRQDKPVLLDFGWAVSPEQPFFTPPRLGRDGRPADGQFCDVFAMGKVFEKLQPPSNPWLAPLISVMTAEDARVRITNIAALKLMLHSLRPDCSTVDRSATTKTGATAKSKAPVPASRLSAPPPDADRILAAALDEYGKGQVDAAIRVLAQGIRVAPGQAALHLHLGALLIQRDRLSEAKSSLERALAIEPQNTEALELVKRLAGALETRPAPAEQKRSAEVHDSLPAAVSIIIPNHDRKELSLECLRSLARMKCPVPFELIFVDNGSQDGSVPAVQRFQRQSSYPIRIVENGTNLGFAKACNQGAKLAAHPVLLFLNNDTLAQQDFLTRPVELIRAGTGVVGIKLLYPDGLIQHAGIAFDRQKVGNHVFSLYPGDYPPASRTREMQAVTGACLFISKNLFQEVGGFDEAYVNGHEDLDLCFKVRAKGRSILYCADAQLTHLESQSASRLDKALENRKLFLQRWSEAAVNDLEALLALPQQMSSATSSRSKHNLPSCLNIALKIGVPDRTHRNWGDIMFAESLRDALNAAGNRTVIHYLNEWNQEDRQIDVAIHIKGLSRYELKSRHLNVLWIINHPELHTVEEMERYDLVLIASEQYYNDVRPQLQVPVYFMPQAADVRYVNFTQVSSRESAAQQDIDILFVGNNYEAKHGRCRAVIEDLLKSGVTGNIKVVGKDWEGYVPDSWLLAEFVAPEQLPHLYRRASIVLNDHQSTMQQRGFINNRVYDLAHLRVFQISNRVAGLEQLGVVCYSDPMDLADRLKEFRSDPKARAEVVERVFQSCASCTFPQRASAILRHIRARAAAPAASCERSSVAAADLQPVSAGAGERTSELGSERLARFRSSPWRKVKPGDKAAVCVLMATFNRRATLGDAIQSVIDQTFQDWVLMIVNDGGEDVWDVIAQFDDPRIQYLNRPHEGKSAALNAALRASDSEYIAYLDDDDRFFANHLEALVSYLHAHPEHAFVYSMAEEVSTHFIDGAWKEQARGIRYYLEVPPGGLRFNNQIPNLCAVHKRSLLEKTGLFDESLEVLIDWDMYRRLAAISHPVFLNKRTAEYFRRVTQSNRAKGQITGLIATDPVQYYRHRLHILRKPGYERFLSRKAAACVVVLEDHTRDNIQFVVEFMTLAREHDFELVVIAACKLDRDSLFPIRLAELLTAMVIWDEDQAGAEALLETYLRQPWCKKNLVFNNNSTLNPELVKRGLAAKDLVIDFRKEAPAKRTDHSPAAIPGQGGRGISAVLVADAESEQLERCLERIEQCKPVAQPFELLVADRGLSKPHRKVLRSKAKEHCWITVIEANAADSVNTVRNEAARGAQFEYLCFLEVWAEVQHGWADALCRAIEEQPGVGAVASKFVLPDGAVTTGNAALVQSEEAGAPLRVRFPRYHLPFPHPNVSRPQACQALCPGSFLVKRTVFQQLNGFDEQLGLGYDCVDLSLRLRQLGLHLRFEPWSIVLDARSGETSETRPQQQIESVFNSKWQGVAHPDFILDANGQLRKAPKRGQLSNAPHAQAASLDQSAAVALAQGSHRGETPLVSIVIPVFNRLELTRECLRFIQANTTTTPIEVIVVDNHSTDGTAAWFESGAKKGAVRVISNPRNLGFAVACNQGASAARGSYVLFLNNDTEPQAGWLEALLRIAEADEKVAAVGSLLLYPDGTVQHAGVGLFDDRQHRDPLQARNLGVGLPSDSELVTTAREFQALTAACLLVRKSAFQRAGGFDAGYWNGYEDVDLCLTLRQQGGSVVYQPRSAVIHRESQSGPERFSRARHNIQRLHDKWLQRVQPDFIVSAEGKTMPGHANQIRPYEQRAVAENSRAPVASIIILALNQSSHTRACLESIAACTPLPHEVILVDNGSTDDTAQFLQAWQKQHPELRVVRNVRNHGFAGGNNQGLALATGRNVVLLNNDTIVTAGWLEGFLETVRQHPATGLAGPVSNRVSGPQWIEKPGYSVPAELSSFALEWSRAHHGQSVEVPRLVGFCLFARREVIDKIGGLDERFGSGNFEDDDFCARARLAGFQLRIARSVFIHHAGSQTFKGERIDYRQSLLRNWELFKTKWQLSPSLPIERGYPMPKTLPSSVALRIELPDLNQTHRAVETPALLEEIAAAPRGNSASAAGQEDPARNSISAKKKAIVLPPCALLGHLGPARAALRQKQLRQAWELTLATMQTRPFHPEGHLLLAEIAESAGAGPVARTCAERARKMAPGWKAARQFLNRRLKGTAAPSWLGPLPVERNSRERLSVFVITKNEERFIGQCLASVKDLAHEMLVLDTGSTDRTVEIAREHGAQVRSFTWCDDFSAARNAALEHLTGDWVLMLDADEQLSEEGRAKLKDHLNDPAVIAWRLPLIDVGREAEGCSYVPRLFRNAPGLFYIGRIHEQIFSSIEVRRTEWGLENRFGECKLIHHGYTKEIIQERGKVARNLRLLEQAVQELPGEPNLLMNLGQELARSGREEEALARYWEAFRALEKKSESEITPEVRETFFSQFATQLASRKQFKELVQVLNAPIARAALSSSLHFALGLAHLELGQFEEAARHMQDCIHKRGQRTYCLINKEIMTAAPFHCLGVAQAKSGQAQAAEASFKKGLEEPGRHAPLRVAYARFLQEQNRPIEALECLNQSISEDANDSAVWRLGGQIALSRAEFLSFAADWTGEAIKHLPRDRVVLAQRAEALLLTGETEAALPIWQQVCKSESHPRCVAALALCELVQGIPFTLTPQGRPQGEVTQAFLGWYRRGVETGAREVIHRVNNHTARLRQILPDAARFVDAVLVEAGSENAIGAAAASGS